MEWPEVAIVIVTYNRPREIRLTINALRKNIVYPGALVWVLADDSSPGYYLQDIQKDYPDVPFVPIITHRGGWGRNVNNALKALKHKYVFLIEDDYISRFPVHLDWGVALMEAKQDIGLVRYDGVAGHNLNLRLRTEKTCLGDIAYCIIDHDSPHLNVYSNRPHLKKRTFHEYYGYYPEGLHLGDTEEHFAHRVKDKKNGPSIAILPDGIISAFDHIGRSWKGSKEDV